MQKSGFYLTAFYTENYWGNPYIETTSEWKSLRVLFGIYMYECLNTNIVTC